MEVGRYIEELNSLGGAGTPFLFVIDFDKKAPLVFDIASDKVLFDIDGYKNFTPKQTKPPKIKSKKHIPRGEYASKFDAVIDEIEQGNTYMLNLTAQTLMEIDGSLEDIFYSASAQFKLLIPERFVVFSPERFVQIKDNQIRTYPMKGTAKADESSLEELKNSPKEHAEHTMVVDLLRNDISIVAQNVRVESFREYIKIPIGGGGELYQSISTICGDLDSDWTSKIGDILYSLLPAGSITGTPKRKTVEIIRNIEGYERGYFTGIFGYFDGKSLDSAVMIRFIEQTADGFVYKSGGGITIDSDMSAEYDEMVGKVYVPSV